MRPEAIAELLPQVLRDGAVEGSPLATILEVMADLHEPVEEALAGLGAWLDPLRCPDDVVPELARWVDLDRLLDEGTADRPAYGPGLGRLRVLVAEAARLSRWRGTAAGLVAFLETATGVRGFEIVESGEPFHVEVRVPPGAAAHRGLVVRIVADEKPAHVTAHVVDQVGPTDDDEEEEAS